MNAERFDEERELRMARYRARFYSWLYGRQIAPPRGNDDRIMAHWIHMPLLRADSWTLYLLELRRKHLGDA